MIATDCHFVRTRPGGWAKVLVTSFWFAIVLLPFINVWSGALTLHVGVTLPGTIQVFYDTGKGYNEDESLTRPITRTDGVSVAYFFPLPNARIRSIRIDPFSAAGTAKIDNIQIVNRRGAPYRLPADGEIRPGNEIASLEKNTRGEWTVVTTPESRDASMEWSFSSPLLLIPYVHRAIWLASLALGAAFLWHMAPVARMRSVVGKKGLPYFWMLLLSLWFVRAVYIVGKLAIFCPEGAWPVIRFGLIAGILIFAPGLFFRRILRVKCNGFAHQLLLVVTMSLGFSALVSWQLYFWGIYARCLLIPGLLGMAAAGIFGLQGQGFIQLPCLLHARLKALHLLDQLGIALGILFLQGLFESVAGQPFEAWDALVSWDKWAVDMATRGGLGGYVMGGYPQFFPAIHSIFYKIAGTAGDMLPTEQMLLHGFVAIYVAILMLALWCLGRQLRIPGLLCFLLFVWNRDVFEYLANGFVDIPLVAVVFAALALAMAYCSGAWATQRGRIADGWILSLGLFSLAFMKGNGLIWGVLIAGYMAFRLGRDPRIYAAALAVIMTVLYVVPYYGHQLWYTAHVEQAERSPYLHAFLLVLAHTSQFAIDWEHIQSWGRRLVDYYGVADALAPWALASSVGLVIWSFSQRKFIFVSLSGFLMLVFWLFTGSYDLRNAYAPLGFLCLAMVAAPFDPRLGKWGRQLRVALCLGAVWIALSGNRDGRISQILSRPFRAFRPPEAYVLPPVVRHMALGSAGEIRNILYDTPFGQRAVHLNAGSGLYRHLAPRGVYAINFNSYQEAQRHDLLVRDGHMKFPRGLPEGFVPIATFRHTERGETLCVFAPIFHPVMVDVQPLDARETTLAGSNIILAATNRYLLSVSEPDFPEAEEVPRDGILSIRISPPGADVEVALHPDDARRDPCAAHLGPIRDGEWIRLLYWMRDEGPAIPRILATVGGRDVRLAGVEWGQ